jgi:hypothetical protein
MPDVQQGVLMHVVRFDSQPFEGSVVQWPKPVAHVRTQLLLQVPSMGLQHVVPPQITEFAFCV